MKIKTHIRVGVDPRRPARPKIDATIRPTARPLTDTVGNELPTVAFAIEFVIPDSLFKQAEQVIATVTIPESAATVAADVRVIEPAPAPTPEAG